MYLLAHGHKPPPTPEELANLERNKRHILKRQLEAFNEAEEEKRNRVKCKTKEPVLGSAAVNAEHLRRNMAEMQARIKADNERVNRVLHPDTTDGRR